MTMDVISFHATFTKHGRENHAIEVYSFPPGKDEVVHRFATVGVSANPSSL
jgi:hypothetical protein